MTVTSLAVPMAKTLAPVVAPALRDAVTSTLNARNARHAARSARTMALIGVSGQLVDDMVAVPFDEIRLLTRDELERYGLYGD